MSDLIRRQDAIDAMMALKAEDDELYGCSIPESFDGERAAEALQQLPSAEPEQICIAKVTLTDEQVKDAFENAKAQILAAQPERKTGRWIPITFSEMTGYDPKLSGDDPVYGHRCSVCGEDCFVGDCGDDLLTDFCPRCGAHMEVENETD